MMNELLNPEAAREFGENLDKSYDNKSEKIDYKDILKKCLIKHSKEYPQPDSVITIYQNGFELPLFTRKSISGVIGKAKGGKTSLTALIAAAVLKSTIGEGSVKLLSKSTGKVLFFDTEQGEYYASLTLSRISELTDSVERLEYYDLREYSPNIRMGLISHAIEKESDVSLVIIDGGRDIIFDINNPAEAITTMTDLMALSVRFNTHITIILHQNKGDLNARGHFGTELVNKSETVISVNKVKGDPNASLAKAEFTRGMSFEPFSMERDEKGTPRISEGGVFLAEDMEKKKTTPNSIEDNRHKEILEKVFSSESELQYKKLSNALKMELNNHNIIVGDNKVREFIQYYLEVGFISKEIKVRRYPTYKCVNLN